jgi:glutamine synthetase
VEDSGFVKSVVGEELLAKYIALKKAEAVYFDAAEDKEEFYRKHYFEVM